MPAHALIASVLADCASPVCLPGRLVPVLLLIPLLLTMKLLLTVYISLLLTVYISLLTVYVLLLLTVYILLLTVYILLLTVHISLLLSTFMLEELVDGNSTTDANSCACNEAPRDVHFEVITLCKRDINRVCCRDSKPDAC